MDPEAPDPDRNWRNFLRTHSTVHIKFGNIPEEFFRIEVGPLDLTPSRVGIKKGPGHGSWNTRLHQTSFRNCSKKSSMFFKLWKLSLEGRSLQKMRSRPQHYWNLMHIIYILYSLALTVPFSLLRHQKCVYGCSREPTKQKISILEWKKNNK